MAHALNLEVIAEGVEIATQLDLLKKEGCDFAQGYFFAKPVTAVILEALLDNTPVPPPDSSTPAPDKARI